MPASSDIVFRTATPKVRRRELRAFFASLVAQVAKGCAVTCLIADDTELRRLNRTFRKKDYPTDVLSFPGDLPGTLGELAISYGRAAAQASELGHTVEEEIRILMLHGVLHLAGLDHETDRGEMARAEARWRKRLGLPHGLIERMRLQGA